MFQNEANALKLRYKESMEFILQKKEQEVLSLNERLNQKFAQIINQKEQRVSMLLESLLANDPRKRLKESFAQIVKDDKPVTLESIKPNETFSLITPTTKLTAKAISKTKLY